MTTNADKPMWRGSIPLNVLIVDNPIFAHGYTEGYRAAMNSPEVKALVEAARIVFTRHGDNEMRLALRDYMRGVK